MSKLLVSFARGLVVPRPGRFGWGRFGRADRPPRAIKRIGAIGLALAVTVAIGAVSAASASGLQAYEFKAAEYPVEWKGTNTNIHRFELTTVASIECEQATFNTSEEGAPNPTGPSERLEVHPTYSKCILLALPALTSLATVRTTNCNYVFTALKPGLKEGKVQIKCRQRGQAIEIEPLGAPGCAIKIPPQTLTGAEFKNESGKVSVNMAIETISFTASGQCGIAGGIAGIGGKSAYRGAALFEGFNSLKGADAVEVVPAPTITNVEPHSGPAAGGTSVTITGTGFTGATAVEFGATTAASFKVNSDTSITAASPPGTEMVFVTVTTPDGTSAISPADLFTYGPTVSKEEPNHGSPSGGTTVTITGTGFTGATAVKFGSTNAASFTVNSPTSITAVSPKARGAETVDVTVTTPAGTSQTSPGDLFTYMKQ
jgi:hypothetical protein